MMCQPITPDALQFSPPNHPVALMNYISISRMLVEQSPEGRELYPQYLVPLATSHSPHQVQVAAVDANCHLLLLKSGEMQTRRNKPEEWSFPFEEENPIHAWEAAFASYQRDSAERYSLFIDLAAVVDNRVFPGDWARPAMRGITVNLKTVVVKTTYGAHPRLAKPITEQAWSTLEARIHSRDCCAIGECVLEYTEPAHSLPGQRQLFQQQVILAHQLKKPLLLHQRRNNEHTVPRSKFI